VAQRRGEHRDVVRLEEERERDEAQERNEPRIDGGDAAEERRDPPRVSEPEAPAASGVVARVDAELVARVT